MNLNKNYFFIYFFALTFLSVFSQENSQQKDSINGGDLDQVVVTGQINKQSVRKSVFEVTVINRKTIEQQAGNNLADLLNQSLNINIIPNASTGKSSVQLFGLDGQYFKILIDNIPLINDEGLGNNTDLTQINLDDIEQIEIVEGAMGVQYGSNAITGIINIITKKKSRNKWNIIPYIQEETIGNEYGFFDRGRHIQSIRVTNNISDNFFASVNATRNDFTGFLNNKQGKNHQLNDGLRGFDWAPKEQFNIKTLLNYSKNRFRSFYKFEFFDEGINRYNSSVRPNLNSATQTTNPTATDAFFSSKRFVHHLNFTGGFEKAFDYDVSLSYQQQKRNIESYNYRIITQEKFDVDNYEYESRKGFYSKGNFSNFINKKNAKFQLGYELSTINGFASATAGSFDGKNIERSLGSYDVFASSELNLGERLSLRPGFRALFSSRFSPQYAFSLSSKYTFDNSWELRAIIGTSPRLPNYAELFTYFVDVNHDVRGNEYLSPEQGRSAFLHLKRTFFTDNLRLKTKFSSWFLDVNNRIELVVVNQNPLALKFNNIDIYRNLGFSINNSLSYSNLNVNLGASLSGTSKVLDSRKNFNDDYLFALQANANASYSIPKWKTTFATFLKYNGQSYQFIQKRDVNDNTIIERGKQNAFSWLDASIKKTFYNDFDVTIGARNLANVTSVNTTAIEGGAHSGPPNSITLGYGRSYFIKLAYNLNIN